MTRRLRRRYDASTEALWRDACGSAMARRLRKRCGVTPVERLCGEALWRGSTLTADACGRALTPEALWSATAEAL